MSHLTSQMRGGGKRGYATPLFPPLQNSTLRSRTITLRVDQNSVPIDRLWIFQIMLQLKNNDVLWEIISAMEYQRKYYRICAPEKICLAATEIFNGLSSAAKKEVALAQARLAECVVEQAKNSFQKTHTHTWFGWGALVPLLLLLWAVCASVPGRHRPRPCYCVYRSALLSAQCASVAAFFPVFWHGIFQKAALYGASVC